MSPSSPKSHAPRSARPFRLEIGQIGAVVGVLLPAELLEATNLRIGDSLEVELLPGKIMLSRTQQPPLTLEQLVAEHASELDRSEEARAWEQAPPVGKGIL